MSDHDASMQREDWRDRQAGAPLAQRSNLGTSGSFKVNLSRPFPVFPQAFSVVLNFHYCIPQNSFMQCMCRISS
jgi:hypothetical protein